MDRDLSIAAFNAENFYLLLDADYDRAALEALDESVYLSMNASIYNPNKEREKIAQIAHTILDEDFDLVGLCEVGGMETLRAFNRIYLSDRYDCFLHEENSKRGIFVGALAKKGRFPRMRAVNVPVSFSRNLLRLDLGAAGGGLEVLVVHLKSQHGPDRGLAQRVQEVKALSSLVRRRNSVVMGDFNGVLIRGEQQFEYEPFLALPFRDVLEAVGVPAEMRRTHYHFSPGPSFNQLDYIFCSNDVEVLEARVLEGDIPLNRRQRDALPSDHLFIAARIRPSIDGRGAGTTAPEPVPERGSPFAPEAPLAGDALVESCLSHQERVFRFLFRMLRDEALARDALQETYARALANIGKFRGQSGLGTWLLAIARNEAFRAMGNRKRDLRKLELLRREENARPSLARVDERERESILVRVKDGCLYALLHCLPFSQRCAFILLALDGLPAKDAAAILKKSENAARVLESRARASIRRFLCSHCEFLSSEPSCRCENMIGFAMKRSLAGKLGADGGQAAAAAGMRSFRDEIALLRTLNVPRQSEPVRVGPWLRRRGLFLDWPRSMVYKWIST